VIDVEQLDRSIPALSSFSRILGADLVAASM
jgi:hypothetical protein